MESSHSLASASTYLNNLLLARGLLPSGRPIEFSSLDSTSPPAPNEAARIINLIHDLILRRDRDTNQRESLATTIRTLRTEESQRTLDIQKLQAKNSDLKRDLVGAESAERTCRSTIKKLETQLREHKEQILKLKSAVDQVRAKCLSDVRKRDLELEKLKAHVAGLQRGNRKGDGTGMKVQTVNLRLVGNATANAAQDVSTNSHEWKLENETNDFLAAIVNETSTENVALRKIVGETMDTLKDLIGLDESPETKEGEVGVEVQDGIGIPGQYRKSRRKNGQDLASTTEIDDAIVSCDTLEINMSQVLNHCRTILKDPSFVPIEEVQIRDEEIIKLRIGWEKMASRWKEAVTMMDTWRRKMVDGSGEAVDINEISQLAFGRSVAVLPNGQPVLGEAEDLSSILFDQSRITHDHEEEIGDEDDQAEQQGTEAEEEEEEVEEEEEREDTEEESELDIPAEPPLKRLASSPARRGFTIKRPPQPLEEMNGNISRTRQVTAPASHASSSLSQSADSGLGSSNGNTEEDEDEDIWVEPISKPIYGSNQRTSKVPLKFDDTSTSKSRSKYICSARKDTPRLSIVEKLAAVEAEAREVTEIDTGSVSRKRKIQTKSVGSRKIGGRRRSTLSPEELATLMRAA